jgi:hypothetical protein
MNQFNTNCARSTVWPREGSVLFNSKSTKWWPLSNMADGLPITLGSTTVRSTEHLYQGARFAGSRHRFQLILSEQTAFGAKRRARRAPEPPERTSSGHSTRSQRSARRTRL